MQVQTLSCDENCLNAIDTGRSRIQVTSAVSIGVLGLMLSAPGWLYLWQEEQGDWHGREGVGQETLQPVEMDTVQLPEFGLFCCTTASHNWPS